MTTNRFTPDGKLKVVVLGFGILGACVANEAVRRGYSVTAYDAGGGASRYAGGDWGPFLVGSPALVAPMASYSLDVLNSLADVGGTGVRRGWSYEMSRGPDMQPPSWIDAAIEWRRLTPEDLPAGMSSGICYPTLTVDPEVHMDYQIGKFERSGGRLRRRRITSLDEAFAEADMVVSCVGLGARELFQDDRIYPTAGQLMMLPNTIGLRVALACDDDPDHPVYAIPREHPDYGEVLVLGGTSEKGQWSTEPDPNVNRRILAVFEDSFGFSPGSIGDVLKTWVGLRPTADSLIFTAHERENFDIEYGPSPLAPLHDVTGVHLYINGLGGAGHSIAPGLGIAAANHIAGIEKFWRTGQKGNRHKSVAWYADRSVGGEDRPAAPQLGGWPRRPTALPPGTRRRAR